MARYGSFLCLSATRPVTALGIAFLGALAASSCFVRAARAAKPMITPEQISALRGVGDVALAPDGRHIVYGVRAFADPARPPVTRLWLRAVQPDG
ncbi:hypothetical protein, partial [Gluconacetobacter sacchari]